MSGKKGKTGSGLSRRNFIKGFFALGTVSYLRLSGWLPNLFHGRQGELPAVTRAAKPRL